MADKLGSRVSAGLLAAVALGLSLPTLAYSQNYNPVNANFIPGTTYSGYRRPMTPATGGNYWWYGGGAAGAGYGGYYGGGNLGGNLSGASSELLYPTADGPMPTTAPVPSYQTEAMDAQMTSHQVEHTDGPSMDLTPDRMNMPKVSSYFRGFYKDMQMGREFGGPQAQPAPAPAQTQVAVAPPQGPAFARPSVQSRLSSMDFTAKARNMSGTAISVRTDLRPKLQEAEQLFQDMQTSGKLGTFDIEPLQTRLKDLHRRAREIYNIQSDVEQRAEEGKLINDIEQFEFDLRQHND